MASSTDRSNSFAIVPDNKSVTIQRIKSRQLSILTMVLLILALRGCHVILYHLQAISGIRPGQIFHGWSIPARITYRSD